MDVNGWPNRYGTKWRIKIAETFNRLSRVHQRYRQTDSQADDRRNAIAYYSEREHEFTFAKNEDTDLLLLLIGIEA